MSLVSRLSTCERKPELDEQLKPALIMYNNHNYKQAGEFLRSHPNLIRYFRQAYPIQARLLNNRGMLPTTKT
ncbi:MAG: hypothetical protein ACP5D2_01065 [Candidatus Nanoarchaeia archaeon]